MDVAALPAPIRPTTLALAAMQTAITSAGLSVFDGDLDRFGLFALIIAQTHPDAPTSRPIAANSLAMSVGRPFETVRRHVNALIDRGYCKRVEGGVKVVAESLADPPIAASVDIAHDAFVQFVETLAGYGLLPPLPKPSQVYHPMVGIDAAVNVLFAVTDSNRSLYPDWTSMMVFSAVLLANAQQYGAVAPLGGVPLTPAFAVRASAVGRVLHLPETTMRRRIANLSAPGGPLIRYREGLLISADWLAAPAAAAVSAGTYGAIRRILSRVAVSGFPFNDPASAYHVGPPQTRFD